MEKTIEKFFSKRGYLLAALAVSGFLLYFRILFFDFTYLDDNTLILDNQAFLADWSNFFKAFTTDVFHLFNHSAFYYRPILTVVLMLGYHIGGASPFVYHLISLTLHILAAFLVFLLFERLEYRKEISFLSALVFLVHPALTQAVAWVPGMNDSLAAVFFLASFIFFIDFTRRKEAKHLGLSLFFFALSIFTKETALFALPILVFWVWIVDGRRRIFWEDKRIFSGWVAVLFFWFLFRQYALRGSSSATLGYMVESVWKNIPAVIQFIGKIIFPFNLSVLPIMRDTTFVWGVLAVAILTVMLIFTRNKRWKYILFGALWFFIFLLPSFIRPNPALVADFIEHRLYLPIIGFFIILLELEPIRSWRPDKKRYVAGSAVVVLLFIFLNICHVGNFKNRMSFWQNAARHSPDYPLARRNLGAMYYLDGDMDKAEKEFEAALSLNPDEEMAHNNLGLVYANRGEAARAEEEYKKELAVNPYYDNAYMNLGLLYFKENKIKEAQEAWKKTLEINPGRTDALFNLAGSYYSQKDYKNAAFFAASLARLGVKLPPEFSALLEPLTFMQLEKQD